METEQRSRNILVGIGGLVVVLLAVAIAVAVRPPAEFDPTTPQGAVQGYFRAVLDENAGLAFTYLADDIGRKCPRGELRHVTPPSARVLFRRTEITGDTARVDVRITETYGEGPFAELPPEGGSATFDETVFLELHDDRWLISESPWPIHTYCP